MELIKIQILENEVRSKKAHHKSCCENENDSNHIMLYFRSPFSQGAEITYKVVI